MAIDTTADHGGGAGAGGVDIPMQILVQPPPLPPPTATATARHRRTHTGDSTASSYEPQRRPVEHQVSSMHAATASDDGGGVDDVVPERKVTAFALHVAVLEKAASHVGAVCFVWATVVILGGFAADLDARDFWLVTAILLVEGTRVFSRSNELDLQEQPMHLPDAAAAAAGDDDDDPPPPHKAAAAASPIHLLPLGGWLVEARNVSYVLYWLQLLSASACVALSLLRLATLRFAGDNGGGGNKNAYYALMLFYVLALSEAVIFLVERAYWEWVLSYRRLVEAVSGECDLGDAGVVPIKRFFYRAFSRSVEGGILDATRMDLVSFAVELLSSDSGDEQLIGAHILRGSIANRDSARRAVRKIGTSAATVERLVEMVSWKSPSKRRVRSLAAEVVLRLAGKRRNLIRVATIPGAIESISTLLETPTTDAAAGDLAMNEMGLHIMKKLAREHGNAAKISSTRGVLSRIIHFTRTSRAALQICAGGEGSLPAKTVLRSLQVVKNLSSTPGHTGEAIRREISDNVFVLGNIRKVLQHGGERHGKMQLTAIGVLADLAIDGDAKEKIGCTGDMIAHLLDMFAGSPESAPAVAYAAQGAAHIRLQAGEVVALLALESAANCDRILREAAVVERLVMTLHHPGLQITSSRILLNLCRYSRSDHFLQLSSLTAAVPIVFKAIMVEKSSLLEVSIGLAIQITRLATPEFHKEIFGKAGVPDTDIAGRLVEILKEHRTPRVKVPRMRRFVIELAIAMMRGDAELVPFFRSMELEKELRSVVRSTSELESFNMFSGSIGLSRHSSTLASLVDDAMEIMQALQDS
ncbi:uncharacterized protein [Oryza sativa Japonica Group]|jgi:hypothetical protein|uniref:BLE2 protein-like protein n=3 Tax=Oryza TaxID=4527 RepID=A0A0P0X9E5_ORYSJ|nr:uncharacterized protein LOC4344114 [Oryza sativa Japonica Group]XP_025882588.1 uncharacterized protein LOC4344114 [Oryza sativa Japonica Group]XP_025882589.1 uncharacterized protein LOC4344114 [Oryza sativa Japonica Group]XP_025882590.1 uncharacterized protein LOC4344114 [Oryza sativa Japonica Group]XP_025882591.1 uncharacterized protein LOC4344114 [Oryza sativa Japonica Group]XP_025882592.1 uncharacterized protein LOC4344114 [Oryza sativa Japonica Group]XP_025882593.1 uncharacterized prot|eukprot:NP_001060474.1 Os07g0648000 [Oryza sativa Japonica Group]